MWSLSISLSHFNSYVIIYCQKKKKRPILSLLLGAIFSSSRGPADESSLTSLSCETSNSWMKFSPRFLQPRPSCEKATSFHPSTCSVSGTAPSLLKESPLLILWDISNFFFLNEEEKTCLFSPGLPTLVISFRPCQPTKLTWWTPSLRPVFSASRWAHGCDRANLHLFKMPLALRFVLASHWPCTRFFSWLLPPPSHTCAPTPLIITPFGHQILGSIKQS